jgi:hypothetical protein
MANIIDQDMVEVRLFTSYSHIDLVQPLSAGQETNRRPLGAHADHRPTRMGRGYSRSI